MSRDSNLELTISTNLTNNWTYFNFALINSDTGDALDFGREVSYYYGTDSDGRWTEGSAVDVATLSTVPAPARTTCASSPKAGRPAVRP